MKRFWMGLALVAGSMAMAKAEPLRDDTLRLLADKTVPTRAVHAAKGESLKPGAKRVLANVVENAILRMPEADRAPFDEFGRSVAVDGNTVVVGAHRNDEFPLQPDYTSDTQEDGVVYVYTRSGDIWSLQQRLVPSDHAANDQFGFSVAVQGDTLVVGSPQSDGAGANVDRGAAYVFTRSGSTWTEQTKLVGSASAGGSFFGTAVAIDDGTIVVTAPRDDEDGVANSGSAYVFVGAGATWTEQERLLAPFPQQDDAMGNDVDIDGDVVIVGARAADDGALIDTGAAYVFTRNVDTWTASIRFESLAQQESGQFGHAVAVSAGTVAVSDHLFDSGKGSVQVYTGAGAAWVLQQDLLASDGEALDFFGHALSLRGDVLLIGAYNADIGSNNDRGAGYRFERSGGTWQQVDKYITSDHALDDRVAFDVDFGQGNIVLGAPFEDAGAANVERAGAAYVYHLGTPTTTIQILNPIPTVFGGLLGLSAQVSGGTPTGNVEFRNGPTVLASVPVNGSGVAATTITPNAGSYSVVAHYLGDGVHLPSNSSATAFTVAKVNTTLALGSNVASPSTYGQSVTFTATVAAEAGAPAGASPVTGNVEFRDGATLLATVPLSGGSAAYTTNALLHNTGTAHPISANFIANTNYNGSTAAAIDHVVNKATPVLSLVSNPNPSLFQQSVTLTATLTGGLAPTGTITFFDGLSLLGSNPVAAGVATRSTSSLALGTHNLQATYAGDDNHESVITAAPIVHEVLPSADVSVTKSNGTNFVQSGQDTTYTIVVSNPAGGAAVNGLLLNDTLNPAYFDVAAADWSCAPAGICTPESGTGDIAGLSLNLPADSTVTITLTVPVLLTAESGVSNTVTLTMPNDVGDPNPANNTATDSDGSGLFTDGFEDVAPLN